MVKHTLKILRCLHHKMFKVYLTILQHYAWKGWWVKNWLEIESTRRVHYMNHNSKYFITCRNTLVSNLFMQQVFPQFSRVSRRNSGKLRENIKKILEKRWFCNKVVHLHPANTSRSNQRWNDVDRCWTLVFGWKRKLSQRMFIDIVWILKWSCLLYVNIRHLWFFQ